jgi:hypothetical protein
LIFCDLLHELRLSIQRPVICTTEIILVALRQAFSEFDHALDDSRSMPHQCIPTLLCGRVKGVDYIGLNLGNGMRKQEVLREIWKSALGVCGTGSVGVGRGYGQRASKEDGSAAVVYHDDTPQLDTQLAFFLGKCTLL